VRSTHKIAIDALASAIRAVKRTTASAQLQKEFYRAIAGPGEDQAVEVTGTVWAVAADGKNPDGAREVTASARPAPEGWQAPAIPAHNTPVPLKRTYSSREVAALTGLTARQLQWWNSHGVFLSTIGTRPTAAGGFTERRYSPVECWSCSCWRASDGGASPSRTSGCCSTRCAHGSASDCTTPSRAGR